MIELLVVFVEAEIIARVMFPEEYEVVDGGDHYAFVYLFEPHAAVFGKAGLRDSVR